MKGRELFNEWFFFVQNKIFYNTELIVYKCDFSICEEFRTIQERALKEPENSEELMEMLSFVENARTLGMIRLNERIKV